MNVFLLGLYCVGKLQLNRLCRSCYVNAAVLLCKHRRVACYRNEYLRGLLHRLQAVGSVFLLQLSVSRNRLYAITGVATL